MKAFLKFGVLGFLFLTAFIALYIFYADVKRESLYKINERQMLLARQAATGIEEFFQNYSSLLEQIAGNKDIVHFNPSSKDILQVFYNRNYKQIKGISLYDNKGILLYTYPEREEFVGADISFQPHVQELFNSRKPLVSNIFEAVQGYKTISLSVPIYDGDELVGGLGVLIDFAYVAEKYIGSASIGGSGYAWMIDAKGQVVYSPGLEKGVSPQDDLYPAYKSLLEKMQRGESGYETYSYKNVEEGEDDNILRLAAFAPVKILTNIWSLAVVVPQDEAYEEISGFYKKMLFIMIMMFVAFAFYINVVYKMMKLSVINTELAKRFQAEVDKRKEQEEMLLQQAKFTSMGEMINAIAHQWRQPLTAIGFGIQEMGETAKEKKFSDEDIDAQVDLMMNIVMHMSETIDDFRNFFRPNKELEVIDIRKVILAVYNIINTQFSAVNIKLVLMYEDNLGRHKFTDEKDIAFDNHKDRYVVECYEGEIKQVFLNIFQNARDAILRTRTNSKNQGLVFVLVDSFDGFVEVSISDNGGGIGAEHLDKVFDPYFTTKGESVGLGIGLFMSKTIVEEHMKGLLMVRNIKDGAKFTIRLNKKFPKQA